MTLEKDKGDQGKYYICYPKPPILDMKWENRDINVEEWANIPNFPLLVNEGLGKHCYNDSSVIYIASSKSCEPKRFLRRWNRVGKKYIQEQQRNHGFCQWNGQECGKVLVSE